MVTGKNETIETSYVRQFEVSISFRQYLRSKDQFVCKAYFFKNGQGGEFEVIHDEPLIKIVEGDDETPPQIVLDLTIDSYYTKKYTQKSEILFVCALVIDSGSFFPSIYDETTRFLGAYTSVFYKKTTIVKRRYRLVDIDWPRSCVEISTMDNFLQNKVWGDR